MLSTESLTTSCENSHASGKPAHWLTVGANLDPRFGGVSAIMAPLISSVQETGRIGMSLAAFGDADEDLSAIARIVDKHAVYPLRGLRSLVSPSAPANLERQIGDAAGVHIHGLWQEHCALAAREARRQGKPYIISAHGMLDPWALQAKKRKKAMYLSLVERRNLQGAACLHALTEAEAEAYRKLAPGVPVTIIPNGAAVPPEANPEVFLAQFPEVRGRRLVLFLARLHPKKGLDILCQAWRAISAQWPEAQLILAGPDADGYRATTERSIESLGLRDRITFTGMLKGEQKWSALAAADLFVLPSYSEGLSVSVLEALGMGCPVLVTEQCHVAGIVEAGCGWQIQPRASEIGAAVSEFFSLPEAVTRGMGNNGRDLVRHSYRWETIGQQMAAVYEWASGGLRSHRVVS